LTLLLAICQQTQAQLEATDLHIAGFGEQLDALTTRVHEVLHSRDWA
jgi:hypothetical protein